MNKKIKSFVLLTVLISVMVIPYIPMANSVPDTSSHNDIVIDGEMTTDWTDGNFTVRVDPDTTGWGPDWQLDGMAFALNESGFAIGLNGRRSGLYGNYFDVFIDTDQGGAGLKDFNLATTFPGDKKLTFTSSGFIPDFVLHAPGSAATMPEDEWELWQFTDDLGSVTDLSATSGFDSATANSSYDISYEAFVPWVAIYPSGIPADAEIRLFAAMIGGEPGDVIPNQYLDVDEDNIEYSNYMAIRVADADGDPQLIPYTLGWPGADNELGGYTSASINEVEGGGVTLGLEMIITYELWFTGSNHDFMNTTDAPLLHYTYWNETAVANDSEVIVPMFHQAGYTAGDGNNELYHFVLDLIPADGYAVDDKFYWYILAGDLPVVNVTKFVNTIVPMPPIDIGFVGNIQPAGGFRYPDTDFDVSVQIEQLWDGDSEVPVAFDVGTVVTLNYTLNDTGIWNTMAMEWSAEQGRNAEYDVTFPGQPENSTFTFNIIVENNNTVITSDFLVLILIPPPEDEIFYMTDPEHDEWGTYPTDVAFGGLTEGLFDILEFNVSSNIYGSTFAFRLADSITPLPDDWGAGNFSHQLFVVYVDSEAGGSTDGVLRSYANIEEDHAWDHAFYADGWQQRYFTPTTILDPKTTAHGMISWYEFDEGEHWFYFNVPETLFGEVADNTWNYVAMSGSGDFNDFRNHMAEEGDWNFGGGDDSDADPNYCDILVPVGGDSAAVQEEISSSYDVASGTRVTLLAVGHDLTYVEDTTVPLVEITAPENESVYTVEEGAGYDLTVEWTASDPDDATFSGLASVKLYVNGILIPNVTGNSAVVELDVGENVIRVVAFDNSGNSAVDEIVVTLEEEGGGIPGYGLGIMTIAIIGTLLVLIKKYKK